MQPDTQKNTLGVKLLILPVGTTMGGGLGAMT